MIIHKRGGRIKRGHGIFDYVKPIFEGIKSIASNPATGEVIKNSIALGQNTKNIVDSIRKKPVIAPPLVTQIQSPMPEVYNNVQVPFTSEINDVIARINKLKTGSGCGCNYKRKHTGRGFRYI